MKTLTLKRPLIALLAGASIIGLSAAGALAQQTPAQIVAKPFPQVGSDVSADPGVVFGVLPNGLRYAIKKNSLPAGQVALRLRFDVGSANEGPGQYGLAHFVEHMAFNGSTHVEAEQIFKTMQRLGAQMGADTNASTGQRDTIYMFNLPHSDDESVDTALMLFRETASELTIAKDSVDRERGVVLSEERSRASPNLRAAEANLKFMFGDHAMARLPIGERKIIETAPPSQIKAFYDAYYRPERAVLVVVGDIDPAAIEAKIKARFSDWKGRGAGGPNVPPLDVAKVKPDAALFVENGIQIEAGLTWLAAPENRPESRAAIRQRMVDGFAMNILARRFSDVATGANPPFLSAFVASDEARGFVRQTSIAAAGAKDVKDSIEPLVRIQRQALQYGLRQDELDRVIVNTRTALQGAVASAPTRRTAVLVDNLLGSIVNEQVFRTPQQALESFEATVPTVTLTEVNAALRNRFQGQGPLLFVADGKPVEGGEPAVEQVFAAARSAPVTALAQVETKPWPYTSFGSEGTVKSRKAVADLGLTFVTFANGVRLTVKPTDFTKDQIQVSVMFGAGQLDLPKDKVSPAQMWGAAFVPGGLGKMTAQDWSRTSTGKRVSLGVSLGEGGFVLNGLTRPQDFGLQMQYLAAYATDAAWAPPGFEQGKNAQALMLQSIDTQPQAVFSLQQPYLVHGKDSRWAPPTPEMVKSIDVPQIKSAMAPLIADADMEVVIVGDITVDEAIAQTARTFGALPARKPRTDTTVSRQVAFPAGSQKPVVVTHKGRPDQGVASVSWPTAGFWVNPETADQLRILQIILTQRVEEELREKEGKSYGVGGDSAQSRVFDYGVLTLQTEVSAENMAKFFEIVDRNAADLRTKEPTQDEVDRAIRPRREALRRTFKTNAYWSTYLLGVQLYDNRVEDLRRNDVLYDKVTPASVRQAAQTFLVPEKAWRMEVVPEGSTLAAK